MNSPKCKRFLYQQKFLQSNHRQCLKTLFWIVKHQSSSSPIVNLPYLGVSKHDSCESIVNVSWKWSKWPLVIELMTLIHFQLVKFVLSGFVNQFCTWHHSSNDKPGKRRPSVPLSYSRDPDYLRTSSNKWELRAKYQICQVYRVWNVFGTKSQTRMMLQRDLKEDLWAFLPRIK